MADALKYSHPSESYIYYMDFQDALPSADTAVDPVGTGSLISATKSDGTDASSILSGKAQSGEILSVALNKLVVGEDYTVTFLARGTTSRQLFVKTLKVLVRRDMTGEF